MVQLIVTQKEALSELRNISHQKCRNAIERRWHVTDNGQVKAQSVCWLYCWAKTGMGRKQAASEAEQVFNKIFNITVSDFDVRIPEALKWARDNRYHFNDIEDKLNSHLKR